MGHESPGGLSIFIKFFALANKRGGEGGALAIIIINLGPGGVQAMNAWPARKDGAGPAIMILAAASLWSTIGVASVYSGGAPLLASLIRSVAAAAAVMPVYRAFNKAAVAAGGVSLGFLFGIYSTAAAVAGVGLAAFLLYTAPPLWTAVFSLAFGESPGGRLGLAGGLGMISAAVAIAMIDAASGGGAVYWGGWL